MGGRIFNPLQCSSETLHPEMGLGCKATVLPTVTNFNLNRFPPTDPHTFPPGVQAELLSGFQAKKPGRKSKHSESLLEADLEELPCLILVVIDSFFFFPESS